MPNNIVTKKNPNSNNTIYNVQNKYLKKNIKKSKNPHCH